MNAWLNALPELVLDEVVSWLLDNPPTLTNMRNVSHLARTCRRFAHIARSPSVWRLVDPGRLLSATRRPTQLLALPHLIHCETLTITESGVSRVAPLLLRTCSGVTCLTLQISLHAEAKLVTEIG
jgi:hypothetical protein